jgi:hypothetical protein
LSDAWQVSLVVKPDLVVAPLGRYDVPAWTRQIREACGRVDKLDPDGAGPVALTVAFEITPGRNWTTPWKPAIEPNHRPRASPNDQLGCRGLLGLPDQMGSHDHLLVGHRRTAEMTCDPDEVEPANLHLSRAQCCPRSN